MARPPPPAAWVSLACVTGLVLLAIGHGLWFVQALADHQHGRGFDVLDVFNGLMAPGSALLALALARAHRRRRLPTRLVASVACALTAVGLVTTALLAIITTPFGGGAAL